MEDETRIFVGRRTLDSLSSVQRQGQMVATQQTKKESEMSYCEVCREYLTDDTCHSFAGWGCYLTYCPKHCPLTIDGTDCGKNHPDDHEGDTSDQEK